MSLPPLGTIPPHLSSTSAAQRILHALSTCASACQLSQIQAHILVYNLHPNTTVAAAFIAACRRHRRLLPAILLFSRLPHPHVFICNSLIQALSSSRHPPPLDIYSHMRRLHVAPNRFTFPLVLKSLQSPHSINTHVSESRSPAYLIHTHIAKSPFATDLYVQNSLLNLYSSRHDMDSCEKVFDEMPMREVVAWTTMIAGYRNAGMLDESLIVFERMHFSGVAPNRVTMVSALAACSKKTALETGIWIHNHVKRNRWELDVVLGTALVDMYAKCGRVEASMDVFRGMKETNVYTWNSMISGFALTNNGEEALRWFDRMEAEGVRPDRVTLLCVLCACSVSGLVETGRWIFHSMVSGKYGVFPGIKHYGCMVDLLGRAGFLDAAVECIEEMPFEPNVVIWGSLLAGCRSYRELKLSEFAAKRLVELEPENAAHYVMLSNLYAEMGRWSDVEEVRRKMRERGMKKDAGLSLY